MKPALAVSGIRMRFGGLQALAGVDLTVEPGEIRGLIGPNGSGKTTLLNVVTGVYRPHAGQIQVAGRDVTGLAPHAITAHGVARTFQNIQLFPRMTVLDNVRVGYHCRTRAELGGALTRAGWVHVEEHGILEGARAILEFVGLGGRDHQVAGQLPYGQQRRLEIARALATGAGLLLLDEPTCGMNPQETQAMMSLIRALRDRQHTIVLIEHNMRLVMGICDRVTVLDHGETIADGQPAEIQADRRVIEAYLGTDLQRSQRREQAAGGRLLTLDGIAARYGLVEALHDVSLAVYAGEIVTLLGANGAGKTSTLRTISRQLVAQRGRVAFDGQDLEAMPPAAVVQRGVVHVPEGRRIFAELTVEENLAVGAHLERARAVVQRRKEEVFALFPVLASRRGQLGGTLSGGEQQMLALGRALMAGPRLLLLDEPSMGLAPVRVQEIFRLIDQLNRSRDMAILLVEQNASWGLGAASRAYVMEAGRTVLEGRAEVLAGDPRVQRAYLGGEAMVDSGERGN